VPGVGGELFGPGQARDASKYFIILPDAIGHGKSSKPSDGLRAGWQGGTYPTQPRALQAAAAVYGLATSGGRLALQKQAPTRALADKLLDERLAAPSFI
jgi:hypothetical protein